MVLRGQIETQASLNTFNARLNLQSLPSAFRARNGPKRYQIIDTPPPRGGVYLVITCREPRYPNNSLAIIVLMEQAREIVHTPSSRDAGNAVFFT